MPAIVLHLAASDATPDLTGWHLALYRVIRDMAAREGIACQIRRRDRDISPATRSVTDGRFDDGNLHIIDDRSVSAPHVLNCAVAYFWEFWHLDPLGTKAFSSIGAQTYDPDDMPYARAEVFFKTQRARLVLPRKSKYAQKSENTALPAGCLAVFFQGDFPLRQGATQFDDLRMLDMVCAHGGDRPIVVKPHPLVTDPYSLKRLRQKARHDPRLILTDANVHDILAQCAATVSINSTVALEGFLHRKPALLLGRADFHHIAHTVTEDGDFAPALERALQQPGGYAQYLAWYFLRHCLRLGSDGLEAAMWSRFAAAGFDRDRMTTR